MVIIGTALTGFFTLLFGLSQTFPTVLLTIFLGQSWPCTSESL